MAHPSLAHVDHRPWPLPSRGWSWRQTWRDLLFMHWRVPAEQLRPKIPAPLQLETFDGECWLGVIPFDMDIARRFVPVPWSFRELNVRTYVTDGKKSGVWFFSLDATDAMAVWVARRFFGLPYHRAEIRMSVEDGRYSYHSDRTAGGAELEISYAPTGPVFHAEPQSFEHFLTERYCLYAKDRKGRMQRTEIHHPPWPLRAANAHVKKNTMTEQIGIHLPDEMPVLHFAEKIKVVNWSPDLV